MSPASVSTSAQPSSASCAAQSTPSPLKVVYVGGMGRSGSTLLEQLLVREYGWLSVGELNQVWRRGMQLNAYCACGEHFRECQFWRDVMTSAFGSMEAAPVDRAVALQRATLRMRQIPRFEWPSLRSPAFSADFAQYQQLMLALLRGIRAVSGTDVILDSSKTVPAAYTLTQCDGIELGVLHLIRDARAVCFSWTRVKEARDGAPDRTHMARFNPLRTALDWSIVNRLFERFGGHAGDRVMRCRYEDFVAAPEETVARIEAWAGALFGPGAIGARRQTLAHGIGGNPMRFDTGPLHIRLDDAWRREMAFPTRSAVTMIAAPMMRRYGYEL